MSRYIPDLRSSFPEVKNITEDELKRLKEKTKKLSTPSQRRMLGRKAFKLIHAKKPVEERLLAKKVNKELKKLAIEAGKLALEKVKILENQLLKVNVFKKRVYPKYEQRMKSEFYSTKEWRDLRWKVIEKAKGCCAVCGRSNKAHGIIMHVDHIKPRSKFPQLELDSTNLQLLCEECNLGKGALIQTF